MNVIQNMQICKFKIDKFEDVMDELIVEFSFEIFINDEKLITLMCTPSNLECLAVGYLYSEGIIRNYSDIEEILINKNSNAFVYTHDKIDLTCKHSNRTKTSGCGNGSMSDIEFEKLNISHNIDLNISVGKIAEMENSLMKMSGLFNRTGGVHNSSLWDLNEMIMFHEDIGRHNTVDKIIGEALIKDIDLSDKIIFTSGRISSEMLIKSVKAGITIVISRSAVTVKAKEIADKLGITLIGFSRKNRFNIYSDKNSVVNMKIEKDV
ncbi:formate dehydrogenase accessory sulfurtransferase FdhD [Clostridiaceae bacterium HSG29]|nr:formate dehydrogenase accessory sulfurtransferase FdhD [Clostridiaceae bacterium HSG29]